MIHGDISPECKQIFIRLEEKIDTLIANEKDFYAKWDKHVETSIKQRAEHESKINILTWLFSILCLPVIFMMLKQF